MSDILIILAIIFGLTLMALGVRDQIEENNLSPLELAQKKFKQAKEDFDLHNAHFLAGDLMSHHISGHCQCEEEYDFWKKELQRLQGN